ncbi:conserved protein of unknown function (plasmid) [Magnetospirillum sp. XM-1]|uniref:LPD1 domain-containing protein n=1 Tax=Magnetospirillum sp. XM-1 TaxID=1663591 RepID=UPI00073DEF8C|nr:LPD1 domain-containing protein [Magnetospirillum sp. XM-1]CUW41942.1 conserved protein of unknown function [Magnetospirillum sp. XM-1]
MAGRSTGLGDAGAKIGGARKDLWASRGMALSDLDGMTGAEAAQYVTKDAVWPKPDWAALIAAGMEPAAAARVKILRDGLAAKPLDRPEERPRYVAMVGEIRAALESVRTVQDFAAISNSYVERVRGMSQAGDKEGVRRFYSAMKVAGRMQVSAFPLNGRELRKAEALVRTGWPSAEAELPWMKGIEIEVWPGRAGEDPTFAVRRLGRLAGMEFDSREEAMERLKADWEAKRAKRTSHEEPNRPHLDDLKRIGPDHRRGRDVHSEDFVRVFGFRGVEFGNWVADDERRKSMNAAFDGMMDLAEIMGVEPKGLSLDGRLGLAFGSRGKGSFAAHYEPGKEVINLTKLSGAGSLAHEWFHAVDHYFGEVGRPDAWKGGARGMSGWMEMASYPGEPREKIVRVDVLPTGKQKPVYGMVHRLDHLPRETYAASDAVMRTAVGRRHDADFFRQACRLSGNAGSSGYWARPTELGARAFESWAFDRLAEKGRKSDYLVHGVEPERYADSSRYKGNPYPTGEERVAINRAFDGLAHELAGHLGRAQEKAADFDVLAGRPAPKPIVLAEVPRLAAIPASANPKGIHGAEQLSFGFLGPAAALPKKSADRGAGR